MTEIRDLSEKVYWPAVQDEGRHVKAVGWLGGSCPHTGKLSETLRSALRYFAVAHARTDPLLGVHTCGLCTPVPPDCSVFHGRGEFFVDHAEVRYVLPQMVVHYVEAHGYHPPDEFLEALAAAWARVPEGRRTAPVSVLSDDERLLQRSRQGFL